MRVMRRCVLFLVFAFLVAGCWPYTAPPGDAPLRYRDEVFATVTKTADITYGSAQNISGQTVTLLMDIYRPTGDTVTGRPAIIWVHGGSFCCGTKTSPEIVDEANTFAKKGYVTASINYRLEPTGCSASGPTANCITAIANARDDGLNAVAFLRNNASTYGIDPNRIAIGGSSAGAIIAMDVGYSRAENPTKAVRAAISLSGANLLSTVNAGDAPALLLHGTADTTVPYQWAVNTRDRAQAVPLDVWLTSWQGDGHVPYAEHRTEIIDQSRNFLWWAMDLKNAPK
jgi:acetyl esterase/lipase